MNKNGGIFQTWFKHFTTTVFMQSFQAIFLTFSLKMLSEIQITKDSTNFDVSWTTNTDGVLIILTIVVCMSLIKFEKLIKKLLGIEDSFVGDTSGSFGKMLAGAKSAIGMYQTVKKPFDEHRTASLEKGAAGRNLNRLGVNTPDDDIKDYAKSMAELQNWNDNTDEGKAKKKDLEERLANNKRSDGKKYNLTGYFEGDPNKEEEETRKEQAKQAQAAFNSRFNAASAGIVGKAAGGVVGGATSGRPGGNATFIDANGSTLIGDKNENNNLDAAGELKLSREERKQDAVRQARFDYDTAQHKMNKSKLDAMYNIGGTVASLSVGLGATDEIAEAVTVANLINQPLAAASTGYAFNKASKDAFNTTKVNSPTDNRFETKKVQEKVSDMVKEAYSDLGRTVTNGHKIDIDKVIKKEINKNIKKANKDVHHNARNVDDT